MAGYSGTPLPRKLGIKPGQRLCFVDAPESFVPSVSPLPDEVLLVGDAEDGIDLAVLFRDAEADLRAAFAPLADRLDADGMLWVAWPKRASGVPTDLSEDRVRAVGLDAGLVDVKVCAIDATWSGLKFVYRTRDRAARR